MPGPSAWRRALGLDQSQRALVEQRLVLPDANEQHLARPARRPRLEILDAVRRFTPVAARRIADLVRTGLLLQLFPVRGIGNEGVAFRAGGQRRTAPRCEHAAGRERRVGATL